MDNYGLQDPQKLLSVLRALKKYEYDVKRIITEFSVRRSMKKERLAIQLDRGILEHRIRKVKDLLPLAEQLSRLNIGIGELLAFHFAVHEKADMEKRLGGQEHDKAIQQICMFNAITSNVTQAFLSIFLQSLQMRVFSNAKGAMST
jgi:hypothetical protein